MKGKFEKLRSALCAAVVSASYLAAPPAPAQSADLKDDPGLVPLIPEQAVFFVERRGHEAVRQAFAASNFGKMALSDVIKQFVNDSRVRTGRMIVKNMFDLQREEEITRCQQLLHGFLKPFWYKPCAIFVTAEKMRHGPALGVLCRPGQYKDECRKAVEALMKVGLASKGKPGRRQPFEYEKGVAVWHGVAKRSGDFELPEDPVKRTETLKDSALFMVSWNGSFLCVATTLPTADAMSDMFAPLGKTPPKSASKSLVRVMHKTALRDWAFRWYADVDAIRQAVGVDDPKHRKYRVFHVLGVDKICGVGGTGGYADNVYTRMTYVDAPDASGGLLRLFKEGGSYQRALSLVPSGSSFCLGGQLDTDALLKTVEDVVMGGKKTGDAGGPAAGSGTTRQAPEGKSAQALKLAERLLAASDGSFGLFAGEFMPMMMMGGPPGGAVLGMKDPVEGARALEGLLKFAGLEFQDEPGPDGKPKAYRKITLRKAGERVRLAVLKDRVVVGVNEDAVKAAIDAALDDVGGQPPDGETARLFKLAGDGSGFFAMDLAGLAKQFWPLIDRLAQEESAFLPFASVPSSNTMVRILGPEVAVFRPDPGGLLLKSRGKIPFATKVAPYSVIVMLMFAGLPF